MLKEELQKIPDLEDIGEKKCGNCKPPGLNYKERNKKLV